MATTEIDEMLQRQAARLERRDDPAASEPTPAATPPAFDPTKATPGKYRLAVMWTCNGCGAERSLVDDRAVMVGLQGQKLGVTCGAIVAPADGAGNGKNILCGHQMAIEPGFTVQAQPNLAQPMNRHEKRALAAIRRKG